MSVTYINNNDLYYEIRGKGFPLLFLHGLGSCSEDWEKQVSFFSKYYKVITVDLRGHGKSGRQGIPYSMKLFADDVAALLNCLQIKKTYVTGLSLGGMVALEMAVNNCSCVEKLILVNSIAEFAVDSFKIRLKVFLRFLMVYILGMKKTGVILVNKLLPGNDLKPLRKTLIRRFARNNKKSYISAMKTIPGWSVLKKLKIIKCPVLFLVSEFDYFPLREKEKAAALIERASVAVVKEARHVLPLEKPDEFNAVLFEFLQEV